VQTCSLGCARQYAAEAMPAPPRTFYLAFAASAIASVCGMCLFTALKSVFRSECVVGRVPSSASLLFETSTAALVFALIALACNILLQLCKPRSYSACALAGRICHNWQPSYFIIASLQKSILTALLIVDASHKEAFTCPPASLRSYLLAVAFAWHAALFSIGLSAIGLDLDRDVTPALRRSAYSLFAFCALVDAFGSFVWGNTLATLVTISIASYQISLDRHITSSIGTQVVISMYFLVQSLRSRSGRAWAVAPLRFELNVTSASELSLPQLIDASVVLPLAPTAAAPIANHDSDDKDTISVSQSAAAIPDEAAPRAREFHDVMSRMRRRWFVFQRRNIELCRVFVVPCVIHQNSNSERGARRSSLEGLELTRPLLQLRCLRCLHHVAEGHPNIYIAAITLLGLSSFLCQSLLNTNHSKGQATLTFNSAVFSLGLGFISSRRNTIDRVAARHVMSSFRFIVLALFLAAMISLSARTSHLGTTSPWQTASAVVLSLIFLTCALLDCSPHLPAFSQTCISVAPSALVFLFSSCLLYSHAFQTIWCVIFGFWTYIELLSVARGEEDCFLQLGAFPVCMASSYLTIFSNLFLLMAQAMISRILVPGRSNYVNASILSQNSTRETYNAEAIAPELLPRTAKS
jgi:hypothetical protein